MKKNSTFLKTLFIIAMATPLVFCPARAQLVIESTGRAVAGSTPLPNDDLGQRLTMTIQGPGSYNSGAKLGFGDFGRYSYFGWNAFVGEFGMHDSDILWLHGKNGVRMTALKGNYLVSDWYCPDGGVARYTFFDGVHVDRHAVSCDDQHKFNVINIPMALPRLLGLRGVMYKYESLDNSVDVDEEEEERAADTPSAKETADIARLASLENTRSGTSQRYGFITSQVLQLFPELVEYDADGNEYVNYIELIPVIIAAIDELYQAMPSGGILPFNTADGEDTPGQQQSDSTADGSKSLPRNGDDGTDGGAKLYQNRPNPFTGETEIAYYIPIDAVSADLYIFSLGGELLRTYPISAFGNGSVTISGSTFTAGMYIYSLVVDGNIVDNKRMILTK